MNSLTDLWINNKDFIIGKSIQQVIAICGDGKLKDGSPTTDEFRDFLKCIPSSLLSQYASDCLESSFQDSGLALQDIINQTGSRIGFKIEHGLFQGRKNQIGFDGLWHSENGYSIVVEVKTTDAYRMNLDTIANYRSELISENRISKLSSILIVVGRKDTGDLEAQIRGSRHAWDIRLISTDAILKLMKLKENLNDSRTIHQINEILKPQEYTRIDRLIDVIFTTSNDVKIEDVDDEEVEIEEDKNIKNDKTKKERRFHPVNFHDECIEKVQKHLNEPLIKTSRSSFNNSDNTIAIICSISKVHETVSSKKYWFAFHPYYTDFLKKSKKSYMVYGCGSAETTLLIPFEEFEPLIDDFWTTEKEDRMYWHVVIHEKIDGIFLQVPKRNDMVNLSKYRL